MDYLSAWFYIPISIIFFSFAQKTNDEKSNNFYGRMAFLLIWLFAVCRYNFGNDYPSYWASVAGQSAHDIGYHKKDLEVISFIGDYLYAIVEDKYKEEYTVYDYNGKALTSFPISNESGVRSPEANTIENFVSIFYNNTNYIFDISKSKLLVSFEDND